MVAPSSSSQKMAILLSRHSNLNSTRMSISRTSRIQYRSLSSISQVVGPSSSFPPPPPPPTRPSSSSMPSRRERRAHAKSQRKLSQKKADQDSLSVRLGVSTKSASPYVRLDRQFKTFKPLTPSLRWVRHALVPHLHKGGPERQLTVAKRRTGGRNDHGHVTVRGRGGGHKRRIRLIDFKRLQPGEQEVLRIEYDPGRSAHIALIQHKENGQKSYILAPEGLRSGDTVQSFREMMMKKKKKEGEEGAGSSNEQAIGQSGLDLGIFRTKAIRPGNVLPLNLIPIGTTIHALSLRPDGPAKLLRSAGACGQLVSFSARSRSAGLASLKRQEQEKLDRQENSLAKVGLGGQEGGEEESTSNVASPLHTHAQIRLQSGEVRLVLADCSAAIGRVSNVDHEHERMGKAGRRRWLGWKPKVRGVAMNAVDHPHGGGRGKSKSNMHPRSIYGHIAKGARTRKPGTKNGNRMVIRERPRRNGKRAGKA